MSISPEIKAASQQHGESRDCAVIAIAESCMVTYEEAHAALRTFKRKNNDGAYDHQILYAVKYLGFHAEPRRYAMHILFRHFPKNKNLTVGMIEKNPELFQGHWIASVRGHVLAIVDGVVKDWTSGRRHYVTSMIEVRYVTPF